MFSPSSSVNPISNSIQTMFNQTNINEENPSPSSNPKPLSFCFPFTDSHLIQTNSLENQFVSKSIKNLDTVNTIKEKPSRTQRKRKPDDGEIPSPNPRKRTGKSDRHSKIYTAQGPRDRRMRLSVHIARKFFDLQDMLGFDKASKTIEWLFCQSKAAIREVALQHDSEMNIDGSLLSNCGNGAKNSFVLGDYNDSELRKVGQVCHAKDSRDKARARARERTREKSKGVDSFEGNHSYFEEQGFLRFLDQEKHFSLHEVGMIENIMGTASSSASNSMFDFNKDFSMSGGVDSSNSFLFGNWDMMVPLTGNVVQEQNLNSELFTQSQYHFE